MNAPPPHNPYQYILRTRRRLSIALPLLMLAFVLPSPHAGTIAGMPSFCLFHHLTGLPCPGCGLTRAVVCCAHGLWLQAVFYHPLGPVLFAILCGLSSVSLVNIFQPGTSSHLSIHTNPKWYWAGTTLLLVIWIMRLAGMLPAPP